MDILSSSKVRNNLALILNKLEEKKEPVIITQYSRPRAVLIDYEIYKSIMERLEDLEDIRDMKSAKKEKGRPFKNYLAERKNNV